MPDATHDSLLTSQQDEQPSQEQFPLRRVKIPRKQMSPMERLETQSQPYIVYIMAGVAVIRGFYLFTDKLVNLSHYPAVNFPLSIVTGLALSLVSEITVSIAGRRQKRYANKLFQAELMVASCPKSQKDIWATQVKHFKEQKSANTTALYVSMGMSLIAASSYLIDSTRAALGVPMLIASALAAYVLYLMFYHGVQTDEIRADGTDETAEQIFEEMNALRVDAMARLRQQFATAEMGIPQMLPIIASGLPIQDRRQVMPILKLLIGKEEPEALQEDDDDTSSWWSMKQLALVAGEDFSKRKADDITRKYRRRVSDNAHKFPEYIKLDPVKGWLIEPSFAAKLFSVPPAIPLEQSIVVDGTVVTPNENQGET